MKPFSTYPEDRAKLLKLADKVLSDCLSADFTEAAIELADLVQAILRDEEHGVTLVSEAQVDGAKWMREEAVKAADCCADRNDVVTSIRAIKLPGNDADNI